MSVSLGQVVLEESALSDGFVRLPVRALLDPDLSPLALRVLAVLIHYNFRGVNPGYTAMSEQVRCSRPTLIRALKDLQARHWISRSGGGPGTTLTIRITGPRQRLHAPVVTSETSEYHEPPQAVITEEPGVLSPVIPSEKYIVDLEDGDMRGIREAIWDLGNHLCRCPSDETARRAMLEITGPSSPPAQLAALAAHAETLATVRGEVASGKSKVESGGGEGAR